MQVGGGKLLHASGAGICIFMYRASVTEIRGRHQRILGELVRGKITLQHLDACLIMSPIRIR
ncbi:hypothetical protein BA896_011230 [Janthinobacterium lividum]|uniref:Uncharacterized protein n=1 Tax=Janthinobacterium lividum TaxID=29581 RepID=A0A1E8PT39_9BURK|nr:hypothetical protein BA896_011230 [Janthinobacterium lividum]